MFRGLVLYLCVFLAFPPQIWIAAANAQPQAPLVAQKAPAPVAPVPTVDKRAEVRHALHLASWQMAKLVRERLPGMMTLRASEYFALLQPYDHCAAPFTELPNSINLIDEKILGPAQTVVATFLSQHANDLSAVSESVETTAPPVDPPLVSTESGARCQPTVWRPDAASFTGMESQFSEALARVEAASRAFQEPLFVSLRGYRDQKLSAIEARRWIGWLSSLREFRNLLARYYQVREQRAAAVPAPAVVVPARVGKALTKELEATRTRLAEVLADKLFEGVPVGDALSEIPRFVPCQAENKGEVRDQDEPTWCFQEPRRRGGVDIEEEILMSLQAPEKVAHGPQLEAIRQLAIKALMTELATVNSLLPQERVELADSCRVASDLENHRQYYGEVSKIDPRRWWVQKFGEAVKSVETAYRAGTRSAPVPRSEALFSQAQRLAESCAEDFFRERTLKLSPRPGVASLTTPGAPKREQFLAALKTIPFRDRLLEGRRDSSGGGDYAQLLAEKLKVWFALVESDLAEISDERLRTDVIRGMLPKVASFALAEALEAYLLSLGAEYGIAPADLLAVWSRKYDAQWRAFLESSAASPDREAMASALGGDLLGQPGLFDKYDGVKIADEALTEYQRKIAPRVREAARADDTAKFMQALVEWKNGPANLVPGPWNFHWKAAGGLYKRAFDASAPALFQLSDGNGHGYGMTMSMLDGSLPDDYLHIQKAMVGIAQGHREALIQRLRARGYTDDIVVRQFGRTVPNVGVLADLILRKFEETLAGSETADRGKNSESRYRALGAFLAWLRSDEARARYASETEGFAGHLYERYLRALLENRPEKESAAWASELDSVLALIERNEVILARGDAAKVLEAYRTYQANHEIEKPKAETLRSSIRTVDQALQASGWFDSAEGFAKVCTSDKGACRAKLAELTKLLQNEDAALLFENRVASATELQAQEFLIQFGVGAGNYPVANPALERDTFLPILRNELARAWTGTAKADGAIGQEIEAFLKNLAFRAKALGSNELALLEARRGYSDLAKRKLTAWSQSMSERLTRLSASLDDADTAKQAFGELVSPLHREAWSLYGTRLLPLSQTLWKRDLAKLLLPTFGAYRDAMATRIQQALAPQQDPIQQIRQAELRLRTVEDERWSLIKKGLESSTEMAKRNQEADFLRRAKAEGQSRWKSESELRRLARNYLPTLPAAQLALLLDTDLGQFEAMKDSFVATQFLYADKDANEKPMAISPTQVASDLNRVAQSATRYRAVRYDVAYKFLGEAADVCRAGQTEHAASFAKSYEKTLLSWVEELQDKEQWRQLALRFGVPSAELAETLAKFERLRSLKPGAAKTSILVEAGLLAVAKKPTELLAHWFPSASELCAAVDKSAGMLRSRVESHRIAGKPLSDELIKDYWSFVRLVSDVFFGLGSQFGPFVKNASVVWFTGSPTTEIPPSTAVSDVHVSETLASLLFSPRWHEASAKALNLPTAADASARLRWLNGLAGWERRTVYEAISASFASGQGVSIAPMPTENPTYAVWHATLRRLFLHWDALKAKARANGSTADVVSLPAFDAATRSLYGWFARHTSYRFDGKRLVHGPQSPDLAASLASFASSTPALRLRIVEDIEEIYNQQQVLAGQDKVVTRKATKNLAAAVGRPVPEDTGATKPLLAEFFANEAAHPVAFRSDEASLIFYADKFVVDPSDLSTGSEVDGWASYFRAETVALRAPERANVASFVLDGKTAGRGPAFHRWVGQLAASAPAESAFARLRASDENGVWKSFASLEAFRASELAAQVEGLLHVLDNNVKLQVAPRSYPYFLVQLNWNISKYGSVAPVGPVAEPMTPSEATLGGLMNELTLAMDLDRRSFSGWQTLLRKKAKAEDWLALAESRRNLLVGAGERRFLGTLVEAPYSVSPATLAPHSGYRPFPLVDASERSSLMSRLPYSEWRAQTENPKYYEAYRGSADDATERPLYQSLVAAQNEMLGEADLLDGNTAKRDRFTRNYGNWDKYVFGSTAIPNERVATLSSAFRATKVATNDNEIREIIRAREALIDFRRTVSELNLRYAHEESRWLQGRGNDIPQRREFTAELEKALDRFAKQMGHSEKIPTLAGATGDLAARRRNAIGKAIYWASLVSHEKVFRNVTNEDEKLRLEAILSGIDVHYSELTQKGELRKGLRKVASNINDNLKTLCKLGTLKDIKTDEELLKAAKIVRDDAKIAYFDNLMQILYFDSLWMKEGDAVAPTRRLLAEMARDQSETKKVMGNVSTAVVWVTTLSLFFLLAGRGNPGLARAAGSSRIAQRAILYLAVAAAVGFMGVEAYNFYEDYWGRPDELEILARVRDTNFVGHSPLMKDESGALIQKADEANRRERQGTFRWVMHTMGVVTGVQLMGPAMRWARGGAQKLMAWRNPMRAVDNRFAPHARLLGLEAQSGKAFQSVEALSVEESERRVMEAYTKVLRGKPGEGGEILLEADMATTLRDDARKQLEQLCRELSLDTRTLRPLSEEIAMTGLGRWQARSLQVAREQSRPRLEFLQATLKKLSRSTPSINPLEMTTLVGAEADPVVRHTPFLWSIFGVPNLGKNVRTLREIQAVAKADLDLFALHDPQMLQLIGYFNQLNLGGRAFAKWELFSPAGEKRAMKLPSDVRKFFDRLHRGARKLADEHVAGADAFYDTPAEREMARLRFHRECFDDVLQGMSVDPKRWQLVEELNAVMEGQLLKTYRPAALFHYRDLYLGELGLAPLPAARQRMQTLHQLVAWKSRSQSVVRDFAREKGVSEDEIYYWMLNREHANYKLFDRPGSTPAEVTVGDDFLKAVDVEEVRDIFAAASELREIIGRGGWMIDREFLSALANADYRSLASRMIRVSSIKTSPPTDGPGEFDWRPSPDPAPVSEPVTPPKEPVRPVVRPEPKPPVDLPPPAPSKLAPGELPRDILDSKTFGPSMNFDPFMKLGAKHVPEAQAKLTTELLLNRVSTEDLQRALGRLQRAGNLDAETKLGYEIAIAHNRAMELAETAEASARKGIFDWFVETYLSKLDRIAAQPMSVAQAREILGIAKNSWPTPRDLAKFAVASETAGVDAKLVDQALWTLRRLHPQLRRLDSVEDIAQLLNLPMEMFAAEQTSSALSRIRVTHEGQAKDMYRHLFGFQTRETVKDARELLGLRGNEGPAEFQPRVVKLKESLQAAKARTKDAAEAAMYERAIVRLEAAERVALNPSQYPARYIAPKPPSFRYEAPETDLATDALYQAATKDKYPAELLEALLKRGIDKARMESIVAAAEGKELPNAAQREEILRWMHTALMMDNGVRSTSIEAASVEEIAAIFSRYYVKGKIRYGLNPDEASEFLYSVFLRRFKWEARYKVKLDGEGRLEELWEALLKEEKAIASGTSESGLPVAFIHQMKDAVRLVDMGRMTAQQAREGALSLEPMAILSRSQVPLEALVALMRASRQNPKLEPAARKLVYHLLDAWHVRWRADGTHEVGDLFLALFAPKVPEAPIAITPLQATWIRAELEDRVRWAKQIGENELAETFAEALTRVPAPPPTPPVVK